MTTETSGKEAEAGRADAHMGLPGSFLASSFQNALEDGVVHFGGKTGGRL